MESKYPKTKYSKGTKDDPIARSVVVNSADEEKELKGSWTDKPEDGVYYESMPGASDAPSFPAPITPENNTEHSRAIWQAEAIGMKVDARWGTEKIRQNILLYQAGSEYDRQVINDSVEVVAPTLEAQKLLETLGWSAEDLKNVKGSGTNGAVTEADIRALIKKPK